MKIVCLLLFTLFMGTTTAPQVISAPAVASTVSKAAPLQIADLHNGATLSGSIFIRVSLAGEVKSRIFDMMLDGHLYQLPNLPPFSQQFKVETLHSVLCFLPTDLFPNGAHTIMVSDDLGDSDKRDVVFANKNRRPRFRIVDIYNGEILSGEVNFNIAVFDGSYADDIDMFLDGHDYGPSNVYLQPGGYSLEMQYVDTNKFACGPHVIAVEDTYGHIDKRLVYFKNTLSDLQYDLFCDVSGSGSGGSHISAILSESQPWKVEIQDLDQRTIKTFRGDGSQLHVFWNGRNEHRQLVPDGLYFFTVTALVSGQSVEGPINKISRRS